MSKTVAELKLAVASFVQRPQTTFVRSEGGASHDVLLQACNNSRLYAERLVDFELSKGQIQLDNVSVLEGGDLANAKVMGTDTPARIKKLITTFLPFETNETKFPVEITTKKGWTNRLRRIYQLTRPNDATNPTEYPDVVQFPMQIMQTGNTVALLPGADQAYSSGSFTLYADAVLWLDDYTNEAALTQTDFLLDFCFDWMMYKTIQEVNFYLKEDERVALSARVVNDSWEALVKWNNELVTATADDVSTLD